MTVQQRVDHAVTHITTGMATLSDVLADPSTVVFDDVAAGMKDLEQVLAAKARIDAAFAWLADHHTAGRLVGSTNVVDYLTTTLGISRREALARLRTGASLYSPPPPPPEPEPEDTESEEQRRTREKAEAERAERERQQQEASRRKAADTSAEILRIIDRELTELADTADPGRATLHHQALEESARRTPEDLRDWLRRQVHLANRHATPDPLAGYRRRSLHIGEPDADGSCTIRGRLPAADAAMLIAALAPGLRPGAGLDDPDTADTRTRAQRRVDQLAVILNRHLATSQAVTRSGVGSILLSVTADDLENMSASSTFPTNTGHRLTPVDLLRLGAAKFDVMVLHDHDGQPLALGRGHRTASMFQKIALFAAQGVCGCPDCTTAAIHNDAHHLTPWTKGGVTDLNNLTLVCPPHHGDNDDSRTGAGNRGYLDRCPVTGRVGRRAGPGQPLRFNTTQAADDAAGARIRRRTQPPDDNKEAA
ncbi:HNH endonuclease signature motif containing protein [Corynebacterium comes]|uniref:HNH nuclease domain-containing protein n=1 Tax=Corynebacterium comes TaxID=2675218 RepID=A0A6B8VQ88_9CORY|nr:HNH endonuclease signature motif containing protein [Corynebacterium comes]QGU05219.1 hypothetical protein CETAM_09850 [Corynebacterium comes]